MSASSADTRRTRASVEAAEWALRLEGDHLSEAERGELVDWLRESPLHVAEMLRMGRLTSALESFAGWDAIPAAMDLPAGIVTALSERALPKSPPQAPRRAGRISHRQWWYAGIAAGLAVISFCALLLHQLSATTLRTQVGERREMTLSDGSIVRLSPSTELTIRLQPHLRAVVITHGEALFHVAKDRDRPFVVSAVKTRVQAVGTIFSVASNAGTVTVTVSEGVVRVIPSNSEPAAPNGSADIMLGANQRVSVSARGIALPVRRLEQVPTTGWEDSHVVFENARVADVIAQFNRRNRVHIRLRGDALASRTVSGVLAIDDPRSFVDFLQSVAGVASTDNGPDEILVTPAPESETRSQAPR